jgi:hypothetical protein
MRRAEPHWIKIRINHPRRVGSQVPTAPMGAARIKKPSLFSSSYCQAEKLLNNKALFRTVCFCSDAPAGPCRIFLVRLSGSKGSKGSILFPKLRFLRVVTSLHRCYPSVAKGSIPILIFLIVPGSCIRPLSHNTCIGCIVLHRHFPLAR